jgi:hypothetical protein
MTTRTACCSCGQLRVSTQGDPLRVSVCHCLACQKRTGSAFGVQARWPRQQVQLEGATRTWRRIGDEGTALDFRFCPNCGSTVWFTQNDNPDVIAVAVGAFADPGFPPPTRFVYEHRCYSWVDLPEQKARL